MDRKFLYILSALIIFNGCGGEAGEETPEDPGMKPAECQPSDCESGACLDDGTCVPLVSEGDACGEEAKCRAPLACRDGICKSTDPEDPGETSCDAQNCNGDKVCENDKCVEIRKLSEGETCEATSKSAICDDGLTCLQGTCQAQSQPKDGCQTDDDCAGQAPLTTCLPSGNCGAYAPLGELCDDKTYLCNNGAICRNICMEIAAEGESCDLEAYKGCDENDDMECIAGTCRKHLSNQPIGAFCDPAYALCANGLECVDAKCSEILAEDATCNEAEHKLCGPGMICRNYVCTPLGGECSSSAQCTEKDSFCCLDDSCGKKGFCLPYDESVTHDEACRFTTKPGIFEAQIQCRWQPTDIETGSKYVEMPPLVGPFGNSAGLKTVIAVWSYSPTVLRFINPETCETLESIKVSLSPRWYNYPAAADFDGDGLMELVTGTSTKTYLYKWDPTLNSGKGGHFLKSQADVDFRPMSLLYDIDNDGNTEIVGAFGSVIRVNKNDLSMEVLTKKDLFIDPNDVTQEYYENEAGEDAAIGNLDGDPQGIAELVTGEGLYTWDGAAKAWKRLLTFPWHNTNSASWVRQFAAYADFGTYDAASGNFDFKKLDGKPEIVISGKNEINLYAIHKDDGGNWSQKSIMNVKGFFRGGPITIGDFNNDGLPEIGIASNGLFGVYDPKCAGYEAGKCADKYVLWERWSQDNSSGTTASSLFDFDGDGQAEAVYADECFTRVYDGKTGAILFSAKRSSVTSIEGPVIADIDNDGSAEILMGSDANYSCYDDGGSKINPMSPGNSNCVDPLHEGIRCLDDEDCPLSKNCDKNLKLCLCETDNDCNTQYAPGKNTILQQYVCAPPIHPNVGFMINPNGSSSRSMAQPRGKRPDGWKQGDYKVCRATRKTTDIGVGDLMIFKDRLDRWVSSRNIWNQHAYNIINIEDDGKVPTPAQWLMNWLLKQTGKTIVGSDAPRPAYNNYRLNKQGQYGAGTVPDITGRFIAGSICGTTDDGRRVISGKLCNRGTKPVSTKLPATFFYYDENAADHRGKKICTSYTNSIVGVGECAQVGCKVDDAEFNALTGKKVLMITNLDENGFASTVECNSDNNSDVMQIDKCAEEIVIVN